MKIFEIVTIILVIIVIVIFLIYPRFQASTDRSRQEAAVPKMKPIRAAIGKYILNTGKLPGRLEDLIICPEGLENTWAGPYLKESQLHDPWGNKYRFDYGYRLQSCGGDGITGGKGQNADIESFTGLFK